MRGQTQRWAVQTDDLAGVDLFSLIPQDGVAKSWKTRLLRMGSRLDTREWQRKQQFGCAKWTVGMYVNARLPKALSCRSPNLGDCQHKLVIVRKSLVNWLERLVGCSVLGHAVCA